ncbi:hypothetical protein [uncultured Xylophilus sp.]|uniref:hypothetical protein n=1 Tax=uncultured Xylophilus sp. TaxID=296832 RepID=UPI0025E9F560|nr:hypothetical protein [uncultured Xylophilus sp.]
MLSLPLHAPPAAPLQPSLATGPARFGFWMARATAALPTRGNAPKASEPDLRDLDQRVRESGEW